MRQSEKSNRDSNGNPLRIFKPLHLYFHTELEELQKHFIKKGDKAGLKNIEPELKRREKEAEIISKQVAPEPPKKIRQYDNSFRNDPYKY